MVGLIIIIALIAIGLGLLVWLWVSGVEYMAKHYPDYNGDDFFNEEDKNEVL